jgi:phosphoenolpyruvate carboxykinase (GTP)
VDGTAAAVDTPIGRLPAPGALDTTGLDVSAEDMAELLRVDIEGWRAEVPLVEQHYAQFGGDLPPALAAQLQALASRLA